MSGEDNVRKFCFRYRSVFAFLGLVLIAQFILAFRLVFITENELPLRKTFDSLPHLDLRSPDTTKSNSRLLSPSLKDTSTGGGLGINDGATTLRNKGNPTSVHSSSFNFVPACNISGKDAISAIRRAKSQQCKEYLANVTCRVADNLYPKTLPRFCKIHESTYMKYVGCFRDDKQNRLLRDHFILLKEANSPRTCVDACLQSGFPYAGVQYSVECFCGNSRPTAKSVADSTKCNMKCPLSLTKDNRETESTCGGYFLIDVYETGVFREMEVNRPAVNFRNASDALLTQAMRGGAPRVVFFLTLNGRALRQVIRLIKSLFHERHYFYIHVDARQDYMFRELLRLTYTLPKNVKLMRERKSTIWGGASLLQILLTGMEEIVQNAEEWNWNWDYVLNLSESDFPLKTTADLEIFLALNKGKNFLKSHGREVQNFILKQGLDKTFVECEHRMWRIGDRKLPTGILMDGGSDWIALHYDFVKYIVARKDELTTGLLTIFEFTLLPAESFFHILLRNSEFCHTFIDNNLHVTNWKRKLGCKCQYKNIVDWCGCSPNDFRLADWNRLEATQAKLLFFGRKFEAVVNQRVINHLEAFLYPQRAEAHYSTEDRYWQSIYHHHDLTPKPDDAILSLGSSLARTGAKNIFRKLVEFLEDEELKLEITSKLKELSVYLKDDRVSGILVNFDILLGDILIASAETWYKMQNFVTFEPWSSEIDKWHSRIQHLQVGSDYDQKEQIFRNFLGSLGPLSEPTLAYHIYSNESLNLTFVWTNPLQSVQAVQNFTLEPGVTANFAKPSLKMPLLPGNWSVKVLSSSGHLVAQTEFTISLAEFYHGQPITYAQNKILNGLSPEAKTLSGLKSARSDWSPKFLHEGIDESTKKTYELQESCLQQELSQNSLDYLMRQVKGISGDRNIKFAKTLDMRRCMDVVWSASFPDPKSMITGIDTKTGVLLP